MRAVASSKKGTACQGKTPIMTTSVQRFHASMHLLMPSRAETGSATMGVITGDAGVGKTIACKFARKVSQNLASRQAKFA